MKVSAKCPHCPFITNEYDSYEEADVALRPHVESHKSYEGHTHNTMRMVYDALVQHGMSEQTATDCIHFMLNQGLLFREVMSDGHQDQGQPEQG